MERDALEAMLNEGLSVAAIGRRVGVHESSVAYWMQQYGLHAHGAEKHAARGRLEREDLEDLVERGLSIAQIAGEVDRSKATVSRKCRAEAVSRRRRKMKRILVQEAGGACSRCGYSASLRALHFHHVNPAEKRIELNAKGVALALDTLRAEARKCILLCSNCHAEAEDLV